jgi:hypothetical protein
MTPPRDGAPPEETPLVASVIPLRRRDGLEHPVVQPRAEPVLDTFDRLDAAPPLLTESDVFRTPRKDLRTPAARPPQTRGSLVVEGGVDAPTARRWVRGLTGRRVLGSLVVAVVALATILLLAATSAPKRGPVTSPPRQSTVATRAASTVAASRARERSAATARAHKRSLEAAALRAARARSAAKRAAAKRTHVSPPARSVNVVSSPSSTPPSQTTANPCASAVPGQLGC